MTDRERIERLEAFGMALCDLLIDISPYSMQGELRYMIAALGHPEPEEFYRR